MEHRFIRSPFTWLAYLLLAFYGYYLNILGPITPFLKDELGLSYTVSSLHFTAFAAGILCIGLGGHYLIRRMGRWRSLWTGAAGMGLSALFLLAGRDPLITIGASFLMGLVGSLILAIVPSALADQHRDLSGVAISEANVIASLVSTAAPLMVGLSASLAGSWRLSLGIVALTPFIMRLGFQKATPPPAAVQQDPGRARGSLPALYWLYWTAIVLAVSVEFCMIFWSADYLEHGLGMEKVEAAQAVSLFLGAMILGRLAGSRLVQRFSSGRLLSASVLLAGAGFMVFWRAGSAALAAGGLFVTGLGVASLYPLLLSLAIASAGGDTVQASARATLASGAAILTLPLVLGRLADAAGIRQAYGIVALLLVCVFLILQVTGRLSPARQPMMG